MGRVKTFTNGGSLLPSDLNTMQDDYEGAYGFKKQLHSGSTRLDAATAGTYLLGSGTGGAGIAASNAAAGLAVFYLNPVDYEESSVNKRTVKLIVQGTCLINAVAPTVNYTIGLYPVSAAGGAENVVSITLGTVVSGSTCAFNAEAKETLTQVSSTAFVCPSAGMYALAVVVSGAVAAKSSAALRGTLQLQQI